MAILHARVLRKRAFRRPFGTYSTYKQFACDAEIRLRTHRPLEPPFFRRRPSGRLCAFYTVSGVFRRFCRVSGVFRRFYRVSHVFGVFIESPRLGARERCGGGKSRQVFAVSSSEATRKLKK